MNDNHQDSQTKYFDSVSSTKKGFFKPTDTKSKLVICIFSLIILILLSFIILIFGQIFSNLSDDKDDKNKTPSTPMYIDVSADQIKKGSLLIVNSANQYNYSLNSDKKMVNVRDFWSNDTDNTYSLRADDIRLSEDALNAFNSMLADYCSTIISPVTSTNKSNITMAWGYSNSQEVQDDVTTYSQSFYDNSTGDSITLRRTSDAQSITESILKSEYEWIYNNMHKYGFIIRYPDAKKSVTGFDSTQRIHIRYVGIEHATYMKENGLCLEEYLEKLRTEYNGEKHLRFTAEGNSYEVYYVASNGNPTKVSVPKNSDYTISGDNMNGFIITIKK